MRALKLTTTCILVCIQVAIYGQSIVQSDDPEPVTDPITLCHGKSLSLKALDFKEGTLKTLGLFKRERYKWTVPVKARKAVEIAGFELTLDGIQVEHAGEYSVYDRLSKETKKVKVEVNKKPVTPAITYLLTESRLLIADTSSNQAPASKFLWTLPNGQPYQVNRANANVKEFELARPKVADLGKYKLTVTAGGCAASATATVVTGSTPPAPAAIPKKAATDTTKKDWFFYGNIGGNLDFVNRKLGVNTIYTDMQFRPELILDDRWKLKFPIRVYYNNGAGPEQSDVVAPQRFTTVDTLTLASKKLTRILIDDPLLINQVESRIIGLNMPISYAYKLPRNENWSFLCGLNVDFTWITNRTFGYTYIGGDSTFVASGTRPDLPTSITTTVGNGTTVVRTNNVRYDSVRYRPRVPIDRQFRYAQIFAALQFGIEHESKDFTFSLKYSIGTTQSFVPNRLNTIGGYNHVFQVIFFEKSVGLQFLADVRFANAIRDARGQLYTPAFPYYYFSVSKAINLSGLKTLFFP